MNVTGCTVGVLVLIGIVAVGCVSVPGLTTLLEGDGARSVADVAGPQATEPPAGQPLAGGAAIGVQVRNLSSRAADVTLRFYVNEKVVHLTLLRVPPVSTSVVIGPDRANRFTAGGTDEDGNPLPAGEFFEGIDFDEGTQAVYQIGGDPIEPSPGQNLPDGTPVNDDDVEDTPGVNDPPQLVFLEPAEDRIVPLGGVVTLVWRDADPDDDARIELSLRSIEPGGPRRTLAPIIAEDPDGVNDRLRVVIENISPGTYEVVGVIRDSQVAVEAVAPGRLIVVADPENEAPRLTILEPASDVTVFQDSSLAVAWSDEDDGPAYITFYLDPDGIAFNGDEIPISPPIAAEPDGAEADSGRFAVTSSVRVGQYSLLGVINDGELIGTARAPGRVRVVARPGPPAPSTGGQCSTDADCLDGVFCNGQERCEGGVCVPGEWPCAYGQTCSEATGCVTVTSTCSISEQCDDGIFCNGEEYCEEGLCFPGTPPCYPDLLCDEAHQTCVAPAPIVIAATPEPSQSGMFEVGVPYCIQYSLTNYEPLAGDHMRFFAVPLVTGSTVEIMPTAPPWVDGGGIYHTCVDFSPIDGVLLDCGAHSPFSTSVFVELRLERLVGGVPTIVSTGRVKVAFTPGSADVIAGVHCPL